VLATQSLFDLPRQRRRSDAVLAARDDLRAATPGGMIERSHAHYAYAGLEVVKVAALLTAGAALQVGSVAG
jgi:predicted RNA-binding protein associated with RNAse of E/G family